METDSLRLMRQRRDQLVEQLEALRAGFRPIEAELEQVEIGIRAMTGVLITPTGHNASLAAVAHHSRKANPDAQRLTMKQLVLKALGEHLAHGATANQLLDFFAREWGRNEILRTSLSPQLSRLKDEGKIRLQGKTWHIAAPPQITEARMLPPNEIEPPNGKPASGSIGLDHKSSLPINPEPETV